MFVMGALVAAPLASSSSPVLAAELLSERAAGAQQRAAFAGARISVPLGRTKEKAQATLALAPTLREGEKGELRFARGLELGVSASDRLTVSLAGRPVSQLARGGEAPQGEKLGVSTLGWVAIGAGVAALAFVGWFVSEMNSCEEHDDEC